MAKKTKKFKKPSPKEQAFIDYYLRDFNGAAAARKAGYAVSSARQKANTLLTKDYIMFAIQEKVKEHRATAQTQSEDMLVLLQEIMRAEILDFYDDAGEIHVDKDTPNRRAIQSMTSVVRYNKDGTKTVTKKLTLRDPLGAMERLARLKGLDKPVPTKHEIQITHV